MIIRINKLYKANKERIIFKKIVVLALISLSTIFIHKIIFDLYSNIKVCLCTIGKKENRYIKEYVEHYFNYGVDKIFLYDNNDLYGERIGDPISDYIKNKFVEIIDVRGRKGVQPQSMNECYQKHNKEYDWFIIYDLDEFIFLKNINNIKLYLKRKHFNKCKVIHLNWVIHGDNNYIYYTNMSLKKRFPKITQRIDHSIDIKSIIRGKIKTKIVSQHYITK